MPNGVRLHDVTLRYHLKHIAQPLLQPIGDAIVVASIGRSGSTLVYDAIAKALAAAQPVQIPGVTRRAVRDVAWNLARTEFRAGICYKTHDLPHGLVPQPRLRAVFLFGSALDAAVSVHHAQTTRGPDWVIQHLRHLNAPGQIENILHEDALGITAHVNAWATCVNVPTLCLRYETLWDHIDALSEFCRLTVTLPPKQARTHKPVPQALRATARQTYDLVDHKLAALPGCFISSPAYAER